MNTKEALEKIVEGISWKVGVYADLRGIESVVMTNTLEILKDIINDVVEEMEDL